MKEGSRVIGILLILVIISTSVAGVATYYLSRREAQAVVQMSTITITKTIAETITMTTTKTVRETITVTTMKTVTETITMTTTVTPLDSDGDGIPDLKEIEYGTDPHKPNYLLFYALKKLPEDEALKFKNIENFDEYSIGLVNLYASLPHDKRASGEVNDLLKRILLDNKVDWLEKNLFDDKFVNPSPPLILSLTWMPVRENLDKIYDINVTFIARDDKTPISYAELHFIPVEYYYMIEMYGMRPEDYPKVFPPDNKRVFVLTPVDGKFDSLEEIFSVTIKDIVGGREYKIVVLVKDAAGNKKTIEVKLPYIRQYENLGRVLYAKGVILGANYFPYYPRPHPWEVLEPMAVHPLLGKYDVVDPVIISKHIDWATGHGVNCFFMSWVPTWDGGSLQLLENIARFMDNPLSSNIMVAIQYEGIEDRLRRAGVKPDANGIYHIENSNQWKMIVEDMKTLKELFFTRDNYLKINGKPVVYFYASGSLNGNVSGFVEDIKREVNIFIISDYAHPWAATSSFTINNTGGWIEECDERGNCFLINYAVNYDAWTTWAAGWYTPVLEPVEENYPKFLDEGYRVWSKLALKYNKTFVPSIIPGFINLRNPDFPKLPRKPEMFKAMVLTALKYSISSAGEKVIKIDTFNEFGEATGIEPTREEGFAFLEVLRSVLTNLTKDTSPPTITSLNWAPTRVVLDKIYDINVTFTAIDDENPIAYAELRFIPVEYYYMIQKYGMRPEDYPKVFPPDKERVFVLTPTDGKFDELEEEFSVLITNIVGGREYRIVALVRDIAGNERIVEIKTPYIRQYENLGRKLYEKGIIVSAVYMPWNMKNIPMKGDDGPLLGNYDASDDIVQFKHIDWATGHGVNVFWISSNLNSPYEVNVIEKLLSKGGIKVGIMPGPDGRMIRGGEGLPDWAIDLNNTLNSEILIEIMKKIATYTSSPNYFKVNGRPAIYIWDESAFFNQYNTYLQIKNMFKDMSGSEPFLIAGNIPSIPTMPTDEYFKYLLQFREKGWQLVDAFTGWICFHSPSNEESIIENLEQYLPQHIQAWKDFATQRGKYFVLTVSPGFDNSYSWGGPQTPLPRSPQKIKERLSIELSFLGNSYYKEIRIDTWNDFGEWTYVEPSRIEGFDYLFILKEILTSLIKS